MQKSVLIVDDEKDIVDFLQYNIEKEGYLVYTAENGKKAVEMARLAMPTMILMDVMMPEMDGIEACRIIRNDPLIHEPIIVFLTSRSEDYSQIAAFDACGDDYISKPIKPRLLIKRIDAIFRRVTTWRNQIRTLLMRTYILTVISFLSVSKEMKCIFRKKNLNY